MAASNKKLGDDVAGVHFTDAAREIAGYGLSMSSVKVLEYRLTPRPGDEDRTDRHRLPSRAARLQPVLFSLGWTQLRRGRFGSTRETF